ncbi:hypothetical protein D081_1810 [Anaerovibrio sp. JC8]|uniref:hypothetical protein n=1 Tax=Anaerovibrio sp. JC8 TaxID=1240085 RepID=UPI000A0C341F|nr:hypothetical protein [Anaerovibrio sp. JC8]ORT99660.1 hypothetical protein D081_1810 [Anaerovibrio sp. JC8]
MQELTEQFFSLLGKDITTEQYYYMAKHKDGEKFEQHKSKRIKDILQAKRRPKNVWFAVNDFYYIYKTIHTPYNTEFSYRWYDRKADNTRRFNSFYCDIDFHDNNGQHLQANELQTKKQAIYTKLMSLPLAPSALVESRNGWHVYYVISINDREGLSLDAWNKQEQGIQAFMLANVSEDVDTKAKDASRVLRVPETVHKKDDSEPFLIQVRYVSKAYTMLELQEAFPPVTQPQAKEKKEKKKPVKAEKVANSNEVIRNIYRLNDSYFSYITPLNISLDWPEAIEALCSVDLLDFLQIQANVGEAFSSILRQDKHPSCNIGIKDNTYLYHDYGTGQTFNILQLVSYVSGVQFTKAVKWLAKVYGLHIKDTFQSSKTPIQPLIEANISVIKQVARQQGLGYVGKLLPLYQVIMEIWKKQTQEKGFNNPSDCNIQLSSRYLAEVTGKQRKAIKRHLYSLEALGIIKAIESKSNMELYGHKANTYVIQPLQVDQLAKTANELLEFEPRPLTDMTAEKCLIFLCSRIGWNVEEFKAG